MRFILPVLVALLSLAFSTWLMSHTFRYENGEILLGSKIWSDFQAHIPLIRSFSLGDNFPPEYPLFPGEKIRYHFLFYLLIGFLEKIGLRLDWAVNLPSIIGFSWFLVMIYLTGKELTKNHTVGILGIILYLFNGSLSFVKYFTDHGWNILKIFKLVEFPSFSPYGPGIVSAFWNWNIFTNQRHLGLSYALFLTGIYLIWKEGETWKKEILKTLGLVAILVILSWLHKAVFLMGVTVYAVLLLTNFRKSIWSFLGLIWGILLSLPAIIYMSPHVGQSISIRLGYLSDGTWRGFIWWWWMNMGLVLSWTLLGFFVANKNLKRLLLAFTPLFIMGNTLAFSPEIAANHKFFNLFLVSCVLIIANLLILLWNKNWWGKTVVILTLPVLILSGIIDMFPIINESYYHIPDQDYQAKNWIIAHTPKDAVFLNSTFFDNPATLAGRKIFYGWPYFTSSVGYNTSLREKLWRKMWQGEDFCSSAKTNRINYLIYDHRKPSSDEPQINWPFFENITTPVLEIGEGFRVIKISDLCKPTTPAPLPSPESTKPFHLLQSSTFLPPTRLSPKSLVE